MYSVGTKRSRAELIVAVESLALSGESTPALSAEVAAEILGCGWSSGGLLGPVLFVDGVTVREDADILTSLDTGVRIAARLNMSLGEVFSGLAFEIGQWTENGVLDERTAAPIIFAWLLLKLEEE